jgi:hypothetical protein
MPASDLSINNGGQSGDKMVGMNTDSNRADLAQLKADLRRVELDLEFLRTKANQLEARIAEKEFVKPVVAAPPIIEAPKPVAPPPPPPAPPQSIVIPRIEPAHYPAERSVQWPAQKAISYQYFLINLIIYFAIRKSTPRFAKRTSITGQQIRGGVGNAIAIRHYLRLPLMPSPSPS